MQHDHEKRLQTQRQQIEKLESAQRNLRADQTRAERITNEAIASTEEATRRALALREENQKLLTERAVVLKNLEKEKEKDEELRRYKGFCDDFKKKVMSAIIMAQLLIVLTIWIVFLGGSEQSEDEGSTPEE